MFTHPPGGAPSGHLVEVVACTAAAAATRTRARAVTVADLRPRRSPAGSGSSASVSRVRSLPSIFPCERAAGCRPALVGGGAGSDHSAFGLGQVASSPRGRSRRSNTTCELHRLARLGGHVGREERDAGDRVRLELGFLRQRLCTSLAAGFGLRVAEAVQVRAGDEVHAAVDRDRACRSSRPDRPPGPRKLVVERIVLVRLLLAVELEGSGSCAFTSKM